MELRQLRYFVTVAEELSFTRAAGRLHLSQPPLSQQIRALEEEIGVELLHRTRREVRLTDAGKVFLLECHGLLDQLRVAVSTTKRTAAGEIGTLQLGMVTSGIFHVLPTIIDRMRRQFPDIAVAVTDMSSLDQTNAVLQDKLDIGIVHAIPSRSGLNKVPIFSEQLSIVLPEQHPLSTKVELKVQDLEGLPLVAFSRERAPALFDAMVATCQDAGFNPSIAHTARNPLTVFQIVRLGLGVSLVPQSYARAGVGGVVFRDVRHTAGRVQLFAIWRERVPSDLVQKIIAEVMSSAVTE